MCDKYSYSDVGLPGLRAPSAHCTLTAFGSRKHKVCLISWRFTRNETTGVQHMTPMMNTFHLYRTHTYFGNWELLRCKEVYIMSIILPAMYFILCRMPQLRQPFPFLADKQNFATKRTSITWPHRFNDVMRGRVYRSACSQSRGVSRSRRA